MTRRIFIVSADSGLLQKTLRGLRSEPFSWAYLGQSIENFRTASQVFQSAGHKLETGERFQKTAEDLREPYLTYLYQIGQRIDKLRWWITSLSYRNVHTGKAFHQSCYLKIGLELATNWEKPEPLVLVVADTPVLRALKQNLTPDLNEDLVVMGLPRVVPGRGFRDRVRIVFRRGYFVIREARKLVWARRYMPNPVLPTEPTTVLISSVHRRNIPRGGEFHTWVFGDLVAQLERLGHRVAVSPLILDQVDYKDCVAGLRDAANPILVPHRTLRLRDIIWAALASWTRPPTPRPVPPLAGMDIGPLVENDMRTHWISNGAADALLMSALVRRWAAMGLEITRLVYMFENQPWERALCWQMRRSFPGASISAYQHAAIPKMVLKYFLAPGGEADAPLPHRIVTAGNHTAKLLASGGYLPEQLRVGGAFQFHDLRDLHPQPNGAGNGENEPMVLVATSVGIEEAAEALDFAARLFDENDGVRVVIKCHPVLPFSNAGRWVPQPLPKNVHVSDEPIIELMRKCSLMVYTASSVCVQAMALGVPLVHLRPQFDVDMDPLEDIPEIRLEAMGLEELREKVRWLLDHRDEYISEHQARWRELVGEMYGPVNEKTYLAFVDSH